jgi:hypothetical protein|tara:strand:- start:124 stop:615 length:492 start_codon:yes stop_codon:yes gene_type:complete
MAFIAAMALGGAAIGALANKKDRKKGALMGLGLGLLGPLAAGAMAPAAAPIVAGGGAAAPIVAGAGGTAPIVAGAGGTGAATTTLGKIGSALTGETAKKLALSTAPVALQLAMTPGQQQQAPAGGSLALQNQQGERVSPYQRAALNRQQRMKGQGQQGPKRFV